MSDPTPTPSTSLEESVLNVSREEIDRRRSAGERVDSTLEPRDRSVANATNATSTRFASLVEDESSPESSRRSNARTNEPSDTSNSDEEPLPTVSAAETRRTVAETRLTSVEVRRKLPGDISYLRKTSRIVSKKIDDAATIIQRFASELRDVSSSLSTMTRRADRMAEHKNDLSENTAAAIGRIRTGLVNINAIIERLNDSTTQAAADLQSADLRVCETSTEIARTAIIVREENRDAM